MSRISTYLTDDHQHCDALFVEAENAAASGTWEAAAGIFDSFRRATLLHFSREEDVLFPAFETSTGMSAGPTTVMRAEHVQMRQTLDAMADALAKQDSQAYLGFSETLLFLMRQHNMKEEQILYPMADSALVDEGAELIERMSTQEG